jgi:putative transferase (TIGR04331 family)
MASVLILSCIEETWPTDVKQPILFLGEWCKKYSRKDVWGNLCSETLPYHWNDRTTLDKNCVLINELYENSLLELTEKLNEIHGTTYSLRYWRIMIGPWLVCIIPILFDRWQMINVALKADVKFSYIPVLRQNEYSMVPNDMTEFMELIGSDHWNEFIHSRVLSFKEIPTIIMEPIKKAVDTKSVDQISKSKSLLKQKIGSFLEKIGCLFMKDHDFMIIGSYLTKKVNFFLHLRLGQLPIRWIYRACGAAQASSKVRDSLIQDIRKDSKAVGVEQFVKEMIWKTIPSAYLEGYNNLKNTIEDSPWPKTPRAIFSSDAFSRDEVFKVWLAEKVEQGIPFIVGQHGGGYGSQLWNLNEEHQLNIADYYWSWGWRKAGRDNIFPMGALTTFGKKIRSTSDGNALMVQVNYPPQSYQMFSSPISSVQYNSYLTDQKRFVLNLPEYLREQLVVRLHNRDGHNEILEWWRDHFPALHLEEGAKPIDCLIRDCRLYISTYNATTYLESLALNVPTIIFWNPEYFELRPSAKPLLTLLEQAGIFHNNPESAALKMIDIWEDIEGWWNSSKVQTARISFCEHYAIMPNEPTKKMRDFLFSIKLDDKTSQIVTGKK